MIDQKCLFREGEGDSWYARNREALAEKTSDFVLQALADIQIKPRRVLEIGCSNGWRLAQLRDYCGAETSGIDPSVVAIEEGRRQGNAVDLQVGTAEALPFSDDQFDCVVFGFCLYLCDRPDLFRIAAEADRVLRDRGYLVIYDFCTDIPYRNPYVHRPGQYTYKMDYRRMFSWNPVYRTVYHRLHSHAKGPTAYINEQIAVTVLYKSFEDAYPDNPF